MERKRTTKTTAAIDDSAAVSKGDKKPMWKKVTRGTLYPFPTQRNRRVKPHETIEATEEEIAKYRDEFVLVKDGTGKFKVSEKKQPKTTRPLAKEKEPVETYSLEPIGDGLYNVLSPAGKAMNDKGLKRDDAEQLVKSLQSEASQEEAED